MRAKHIVGGKMAGWARFKVVKTCLVEIGRS